MANIEHNVITDPYIHEPKGASSAQSSQIYVADGAGSGTWKYFPTGWGHYAHSASAQTVTTTASKLVIDGGGATTETSYLPYSIRGSGQLWDTSSNKITPVAAGDQYEMRLGLPVTGKSGSPTLVTLQVDIGGSTSPTSVIVERDISVAKTPPYTISIGFPFFALATFLSNGGQVFLSTDTGSVDITGASILLVRSHGEV